jgi:hypothetical protein
MSLLEILQRQMSEALQRNDTTNYRILEHQMVAELRRIANREAA